MTKLFPTRALLSLFAVFTVFSGAAEAASKGKIDRRVGEALADFREDIGGADEVLARARGVLVFPLIRKAGLGIGGEYGEGALLIGGRTAAYYSTAAGSIGFQIGGQSRRQIIVFLDQGALDKFRSSNGWEIGVDASVAIIALGAGGAIDTTQLNQPIVAFIFDNKGLMYNLSLEGSKISRIHRD